MDETQLLKCRPNGNCSHFEWFANLGDDVCKHGMLKGRPNVGCCHYLERVFESQYDTSGI